MGRYLNVPLIVLLLVTAIGCSSSSGSDTPSGSGTHNSVCSSVAALKSSIQSVGQMKGDRSDIDKLKADLTAMGTAVRKFVKSVESQYPNETSAIQHDYESLKSAADIAIQSQTYPTIAQVKTEFTTLAQGVSHFAQSVAAGC